MTGWWVLAIFVLMALGCIPNAEERTLIRLCQRLEREAEEARRRCE